MVMALCYTVHVHTYILANQNEIHSSNYIQALYVLVGVIIEKNFFSNFFHAERTKMQNSNF